MIAKVNKEIYAVVSPNASDEVVTESVKKLESAIYMFYQLGWLNDNDDFSENS